MKKTLIERENVAPGEAWMPRFLGKRRNRIWWDVAALIVLVLVVLLVLELTGTTHVFGYAPGPARG
ncbi:MAG: hypothetical protein A2W26_04430 [Acidobacteria bacterium RBG_16_64_8]|nr:MAG: hypothetical protein A2W26_04430 [Acidobacteria bacterium RBG_16_64_8]